MDENEQSENCPNDPVDRAEWVWRQFWLYARDPQHAGPITAIATVVSAIMAICLAATTIAYTVYSARQWQTAEKSIEVAKSTLIVTQGSYITLGRKDGVIAEFIAPKNNPKQDAELVIYFQNTGHTPARLAAHMTIGLAIGNPRINYKPFTDEQFLFMNPLPPTRRFKKTGEIYEGESAVIAGDSVQVFTLGTITQSDLRELPRNTAGFTFSGVYEYCDQLGNWYTHQFGMRYRPNASSESLGFELASDNVVLNAPLPRDTDDWEFLPPCFSPRTSTQH